MALGQTRAVRDACVILKTRALLSTCISALARFGRWWRQGLYDALPGVIRAEIDRRAREIVVTINDGAFATIQSQGEQDAAADRSAEEVLGAIEAARPRRVIIAVGDGDVLVTELSLPEAVRAHLSDAIGFEIPRQTPFNADDVVFAYRVLSADRTAKQLRVRLLVVPRHVFTSVYDALDARGLAPSALRWSPGGEAPWTLDLKDEPTASARGRKRRIVWVTAGAALLALMVLLVPMIKREQLVDSLREDVERLRRETATMRERQQEHRRDLAQVTAVSNTMAKRTPVITVLRELTDRTRDATHFSRLTITPEAVTVIGESPGASETLGALDDSPLFAAGSLQRRGRNLTPDAPESFEITLRITRRD